MSPNTRASWWRNVIVAVTSLVVFSGGLPAAHADVSDFALTVTTPTTGLQTGEDLTLQLDVTGISEETLTEYTAAIYVGEQLVTESDAMTAWLDPEQAVSMQTYLGPTAYLEPISTSEVAWSGDTASITITVRERYMQLAALPEQQGALPIGARILLGNEQVAWSTEFVAWNITQSLPVSVIAPITTPVTTGAVLEADLIAELTSPGGLLTQQLDALEGHRVIYAVDPRIIASIQQLGDQAPPAARDWLIRLEGQEFVLPLPYADADLAAMGLSPLKTIPAQDSTESFPWQSPNIAITELGRIRTKAMNLLQRSGYQAAVVNDTDLDSSSAESVTISGVTIIKADSALSAALMEHARSQTDSSLSMLSAQSARALTTPYAGSLAVILPRGWVSAGQGTDASLSALESLNWAHLRSALTLPTQDTEVSRLRTIADSPMDRTLTDSLVESMETVDTFVHVYSDPTRHITANQQHTMSLLNRNWQTAEQAWQSAVESRIAENTALVNSVRITSDTNLTLASGRSDIPIPVANEGTESATVEVTVEPSNGRVAVSNTVTITVAAGSATTAKVPVQAVANGTVDLRIQLHTPEGKKLGDAVTRQMDVRANWETWLTMGGAVLVAGLFCFGILRSVRRFFLTRKSQYER